MEFMDLPQEVVFKILSYLNVCDILKVNLCCKGLYSICSDNSLWKYFCWRDFESRDLGYFNMYYDLYKWLHKYRYFFGLHQIGLEAYGGIVVLEYENDCVVGNQWYPDKEDATKPLVKKRMFRIQPSLEGEADIMTCTSSRESHPCLIVHQVFDYNQPLGKLKLSCDKPEQHDFMEAAPEYFDLFHIQYRLILGLSLREGLYLSPMKNIGSFNIPESLLENNVLPAKLFSPGLFKGTYSVHGVELVFFAYKTDYEIHGIKVSGDPNVFAGKVSVKVCLNFPFCPSQEEQSSFELLKGIEPSSEAVPSGDQDFYLPPDCHNRSSVTYKTCRARYHGFGQIAYTNFTDPSFTPVHVVVFSHSVFGALFLELKSFSLFERVPEDNFDFRKYYKY